jgi:hypothetical protein
MNTLQNHFAARNPGGNVILLRPGLPQPPSPFDQLTTELVLSQHRQGILAEEVLVALLAGVGLQQ